MRRSNYIMQIPIEIKVFPPDGHAYNLRIRFSAENLGAPAIFAIHFCCGFSERRKEIQIRSMKYLISWNICIFMITTSANGQNTIEADLTPPEEPDYLECRERIYTFQVTQTDANGKQCWDALSTIACWGRCDSNEISDWRFPYKKSNHPVCIHYGRNRNVVTLRHCEEGALPEAARYEYLEAAGCKCQICSSSDTSCEGLRYRPQRSHPQSLGFQLS